MRLLRRWIPLLCLTLPSLGRAQSTIAVAAGTSTKIQVAPGMKFSVPLLITVPTAGTTSATGSVVAVSSIAAQLNWNAAGLTIDSITAGNFGTVSATILSPTVGRAVLSVFSASSASGTVTLAYAWFTASASVAGTQLHLDVSEASNAQGAVLATPRSSTGTDVCVASFGKWGDVNGDSLVNILDAQQIARFTVGMAVADLNTFQSTGDVTGDNAINSEAPIVVMTTEILRNMLYAGSRTLEGLRTVVMDEVHYLQDPYRGAVWEEVLIHLPASVRIVALSATVSNAEEFADWMATVRGSTTAVIEERRPVELTNLYAVAERGLDRVGADLDVRASLHAPTIRFAVRRSTMISPPMIAIAAISSVSSAWRASAITALIGRSTRTNHAPLIPLKWIGVSMRSTSPSAGSDVRPMLPMLAGAGLPSSAALRL